MKAFKTVKMPEAPLIHAVKTSIAHYITEGRILEINMKSFEELVVIVDFVTAMLRWGELETTPEARLSKDILIDQLENGRLTLDEVGRLLGVSMESTFPGCSKKRAQRASEQTKNS